MKYIAKVIFEVVVAGAVLVLVVYFLLKYLGLTDAL